MIYILYNLGQKKIPLGTKGRTSIPVSYTHLDPSIKEFEKIARKYGVDYAVKKDRSSTPPKYLIFFKGRDADALTAAFTEYTGKKVRKAQKTERPSVLAKLSQFKELVKHAVVDRNKRKELER